MNREMTSRTAPNLIDLGVAVAAAVAGSFSMTRERLSNSLAGVAIATPLGPGGLFAFSAIGTLILVGAMLWRRTARPKVDAEDRANWELTQPTAVTGMDIDPRVEPFEPLEGDMQDGNS